MNSPLQKNICWGVVFHALSLVRERDIKRITEIIRSLFTNAKHLRWILIFSGGFMKTIILIISLLLSINIFADFHFGAKGGIN